MLVAPPDMQTTKRTKFSVIAADHNEDNGEGARERGQNECSKESKKQKHVPSTFEDEMNKEHAKRESQRTCGSPRNVKLGLIWG